MSRDHGLDPAWLDQDAGLGFEASFISPGETCSAFLMHINQDFCNGLFYIKTQEESIINILSPFIYMIKSPPMDLAMI